MAVSVSGACGGPDALDETVTDAAVTQEAPPAALTSSITYSNCSTARKTVVGQALSAASTYANDAVSYLTFTTPGPTQRYTTWFGAYHLSRWTTARTHFTSIKSVFASKALVIDCGCTSPGYGFVYAAQPYKFYLCGTFWSAPPTGTDSQAGTFIHLASQFTAVAATDGWVYGQEDAMSLALSDPFKALDNSDSHQYFAENTPALP
ncbi:M35 family metallo-endopeptidase [Corallococcus aberystwythensis]|uniref:M35 family metallo-endopeptidase n=1 Tax=Corallococcus aberystwythensis TaxID=2316722 RepID=UPI001FC93835|nr:M35 family metallo-endopeptidase [Corallococcus aberystwythensis]